MGTSQLVNFAQSQGDHGDKPRNEANHDANFIAQPDTKTIHGNRYVYAQRNLFVAEVLAMSGGEEKANPYQSPTEGFDAPRLRLPPRSFWWDTALLFGTALAIIAGAIVSFPRLNVFVEWWSFG
jgi:hypothetical protein